MTNNTTLERLRLFEVYSTNLSLYHPKVKDTFLCPLCLRSFSRQAVATGDITIEHIIPSKIGGHLKTLTCRQCNSAAGSGLDAHLIRRFRVSDSLAGKSNSPIGARVRIGKGEFGAQLHFSSDQGPSITIIGVPQISNPTLHRLAIEEFEQGDMAISFTAELGFKDLPSRVAALRSAYLLMFFYFGYGYILYRCAEQLRDQLTNTDVETPALRGMVWLRDSPPATNVVGVVTQPEDLRCFLAVLDLSTMVNRYLGVVLPGLDQETPAIYERWSMLGNAGIQALEPHIRTLPFNPDYLTSPTHKDFAAWLWRSL